MPIITSCTIIIYTISRCIRTASDVCVVTFARRPLCSQNVYSYHYHHNYTNRVGLIVCSTYLGRLLLLSQHTRPPSRSNNLRFSCTPRVCIRVLNKCTHLVFSRVRVYTVYTPHPRIEVYFWVQSRVYFFQSWRRFVGAHRRKRGNVFIRALLVLRVRSYTRTQRLTVPRQLQRFRQSANAHVFSLVTLICKQHDE